MKRLGFGLGLRLALVLLLVISAGVNGASAASKVKPSPSPKWPPVGFTVKGEIYAKVPTVKELVGIASNSKVLTAQLAEKVDGTLICKKYACGAITVAATKGCTWWEVKSCARAPLIVISPCVIAAAKAQVPVTMRSAIVA